MLTVLSVYAFWILSLVSQYYVVHYTLFIYDHIPVVPFVMGVG